MVCTIIVTGKVIIDLKFRSIIHAMFLDTWPTIAGWQNGLHNLQIVCHVYEEKRAFMNEVGYGKASGPSILVIDALLLFSFDSNGISPGGYETMMGMSSKSDMMIMDSQIIKSDH